MFNLRKFNVSSFIDTTWRYDDGIKNYDAWKRSSFGLSVFYIQLLTFLIVSNDFFS